MVALGRAGRHRPASPVTDDRTSHAIESSDTDELVRIVDGHAEARSWEALVVLRTRCEEAVTRGKQLWGIAEYIRYRLALDAPGRWAGPAVTEGPTRFTLGPLPEVAASTKTWSELDEHLAEGPQRVITAQERVLRGEDLREAGIDQLLVELPLMQLPWEPAYSLAEYKADRVESPSPPFPPVRLGTLDTSVVEIDDPEGCRALLGVVEHWVETSNGRAQAVCVEGSATQAVAAIGVARAGLAPVTPALALQWLAWAAATGAAHGRRRGAAAGRFAAWWVAHELAGLDWPVEPAELGEQIAHLHWYLWSDGSPDLGWSLRVAVESPAEGVAWALAANDAE